MMFFDQVLEEPDQKRIVLRVLNNICKNFNLYLWTLEEQNMKAEEMDMVIEKLEIPDYKEQE